MSFGVDERWLVLAYADDAGVLETNSCMQNRRLDGSDPEAEALIARGCSTETPSIAPAEAGPRRPDPDPRVIGGAVVLLGAVSALAFRRSPAS